MKWHDGSKTNLALVAVVAALVLSPGPAVADFTFGKAVNLGPVVNSPYGASNPFIASDGLSLYFSSNRPGGQGGVDLWMTTRATVSDPWGPPVNLGPTVNSPADEFNPDLSPDGLSLYSVSTRPGGLGKWDIWLTTRPTKESPWGPPVNLGSPVNSAADDWGPDISPDGLSLYFSSTRPGGNGSWVTTRPTKDSPWGPPVPLGLMPSRGGSGNWEPRISADGLALFFASDYANVSLFPDIWVTTRTSKDSNWGTPILLGPEINTLNEDSSPSISADGSTLYWSSGPAGNSNMWGLWQAPIIPIVDFNGDGKVDIQDLLILIEHWGQNDPLCDIGPMPWGDGKVDAGDLEVLMRYWGQEVNDPTLIARWKLDEASGMIAADSAGTNSGTLVGDPIWQPAAGKLGGALQLDSIDDYVKTPFIVDPAQGPFSVFAWVKGGGPGQVIVSQVNGANWVMAGASDGGFATELQGSGRTGKALKSAASITEGAWHRVGFVWDGSNRVLYVDDVEVAKDTQPSLPASSGVLHLGAGSSLTPGMFWKGLIDDVRIYNRAVRP